MSDDNYEGYAASESIPSFAVPDAIAECAKQKEMERKSLSQQVEEFLASGGEINYVEPNVMADPPKKPVSNYGSQPI